MGKDEETEDGFRGSGFRRSRVQMFKGSKKDKETEIAVDCSVLDIRFSFDVRRSMFDVRRSSFNVTCELPHIFQYRPFPGSNPGASSPVPAFFDINMIARPQAKAAVGP